MAPNKNKAKKPSKKEAYHKKDYCIELTQQIAQLLPKNNTKKDTLHYLIYRSQVTKSSVPTTSRCGTERPPRLRHVDDSAYSKHFPEECLKYNSCNKFLWAEWERTLADPFNIKRDPLFQKLEKSSIGFSSMVFLKEKWWAMSLQGTLVIVEMIDSRWTITGAASNRAIPSLSCKIFQECLVQIGGEIFVIFLIHQKSIQIVDFVEVFRLCLRQVKWIKAERIGGKVIFLDPKYVWGNSAEIGCKGDCIYFTQASYSSWLVYDMKSCSISYV